MGDRDQPNARAVIAAEIAQRGPMRLDRFMALANAAYYATRDPFGRAGDFITAPETTQAYGELIGAWMVEVWRAQGAPRPCVLAEAGPGRGTLIADALRLIDRLAPDFSASSSVHLIETSPTLRALQAARLSGRVAAWHESLASLPGGALFLVASEFLDSLPVRQFCRRGEAWMERAVAMEGDRLVWTEIPAEAPPGRAGEVNEAAEAWIAEAAGRIAHTTGALLVLDYGHGGGAEDTLQAVQGHRPVDPLAAPGEADLSAQVDFAALADAARAAGAAVFGPIPQGTFLRALGLPERTAILCRHAPPATARQLQAAARRLIDPDAMGLLFKALAVLPPWASTPPGFAP